MPVLKVSVLDSVVGVDWGLLREKPWDEVVYLHLILIATCRRRNVTFFYRAQYLISPSEKGFREKSKKKGEREAAGYCSMFQDL